ncbi:MAG: (Fe-S)-binding protein [Acidimicrobiia bacterium]|nr:(Fe-S)-binding protein [Acidimicrobiia bacterium]
MGWKTDHPPDAVGLNACIQCGLCNPHCPTFRLTGREDASPRGRLTAMAAVAKGVAPMDDTFADMLDFCLGCRACETACPSLVPYGELLEAARAEVEAARTRPSLGALAWGRAVASRPMLAGLTAGMRTAQAVGVADRLPGPGGQASGIRPLADRPPSRRGEVFEPSGEAVSTVGLLVGCVMDEWFRPVHEAVIGVLLLAGHRVVVPDDQVCCGALASHAGARDEAVGLAHRNREAFSDVEVVVADAAGCGAHLKRYEHLIGESLPAADVTEVVAAALEGGRLPTLPPTGTRIGIQDPCHLRHGQRITDEPRAVVTAAGHTVVDIDPSGMCCGAAGSWAVSHPRESAQLGERKATEVAAAGVAMVASANPGCEMQLRQHLDDVRIAHPVELYWEAVLAVS